MGMKSKSKQPKHCNGCLSYWSLGKEDGVHNRWCCHYGKPAVKVFNFCKLHNGKREKEK